jgi:hypothetical protein
MEDRIEELETAIKTALALLHRKNQSGQSLWLKHAIEKLEEVLGANADD